MDIQDTSKQLLDSVGKVLTEQRPQNLNEYSKMPERDSKENIKLSNKASMELLKAQKILDKVHRDVQNSKFVPDDKFLSKMEQIQDKVRSINYESDLNIRISFEEN